ncbi:MAG: hypothetical protein OCD76_19820 [Reichenbachiella sp.]
MKHIILLIVLASSLPVYAQNDFKQNGGENNLEVQFAPFGSNPIGINGIRYRHFNSESKAFRLNVFAGYNTSSEITQQEDEDFENPELRDSYSEFALNIRPGFEKHLKGTNRLSPYFGMELDIAIQTSTSKEEFEAIGDVEWIKEKNQNGFFRFGANAIMGFDLYVVKNLYLGAEFGYGFAYQKNLSIKVESSNDFADDIDPTKRAGEFAIGPNANAAIRLGYIF